MDDGSTTLLEVDCPSTELAVRSKLLEVYRLPIELPLKSNTRMYLDRENVLRGSCSLLEWKLKIWPMASKFNYLYLKAKRLKSTFCDVNG